MSCFELAVQFFLLLYTFSSPCLTLHLFIGFINYLIKKSAQGEKKEKQEGAALIF